MNSSEEGGGDRHERLFVSRLPRYTKKRDLMNVFRSFGVRHIVIRRAATGDTAYVTLDGSHTAEEIVNRSMVEGFYLRGKKIRLQVADPWNWRGSKVNRRSDREDELGASSTTIKRKLTLPAICVERIARYVDFTTRARMEMVSRSWREGSKDSHRGMVALNPSNWLWQPTWERCAILPTALNWALRRAGPWLRSLTLEDPESCERIESQLVTVAARNCPCLESINTRAILLRPGAVRAIAENINSLRELYLGKIRGPVDPELGRVFWANRGLAVLDLEGTQIYGQSLAYLGDGMVSIRLEHCQWLRAEPLGEMLRRQRNLASLRLARCTSLTGDQGYVIRGLLSNPFIGTTLRTLELLALGYDEGDGGEEGQGFRYQSRAMEEFVIVREVMHIEDAPALAAVCGGLESLSVPLCPWIDNRFVVQIGEHLRGLRDLNLSACTSILGEEALDPLGRLDSIESLNISGLMPEVSLFFLRSIRCLVRLEARDCRGAHSEDICAFVRQANHLQHLDMEGCPMIDRTVVTCCYNTLRGAVDGRRLEVCLGDTAAQERRKDKRLLTLIIHYARRSPRLRIVH